MCVTEAIKYINYIFFSLYADMRKADINISKEVKTNYTITYM